MRRRDYDSTVDSKFWAIIAAQDIYWIAHCEHLTERAQRQLEAWGIAEPTIDF